VLVVYKKSLYQLYVQEHHNPSVQRALHRRDRVATRLSRSHKVQQRAISKVRRVLERSRGLEVEFRWRGKLRSTRGFDLVLAVGGDGTLLDTAYQIRDDTPIMGINSDPGGSVGHLCAGTAEDLRRLLEAVRDGALRPRLRTRLRTRVNGEQTLDACLNDVLVAHRSPAEMSRLEIVELPVQEAEVVRPDDASVPWSYSRSSGIWVCTATGSTGAMRSAGGRVMPPGSRRLQYLAREAYGPPDRPHPHRVHGFIAPGQALVVINRMRLARLWGDGPHRKVTVNYGQKIVIDRHPVPLRLICPATPQ
jgi:NAD+ kinase